MQQQISRQPGMSAVLGNSVNGQLRHIGQQYNDRYMELIRDVNSAMVERDQALQALSSAQRQVQLVQNERDDALKERDRLNAEINSLHERQRMTEERIKSIENRFKNVNNELEETVKIQEEKLSGKRSLWIANHPSSSTRKTAQDLETLTTPTGNCTATQGTQPSLSESPLIKDYKGKTAEYTPFSNQLDPARYWDVPIHQPKPSGGVIGRSANFLSQMPSGPAKPSPGTFSSNGFSQSNQSHYTPGSRAEAGSNSTSNDRRLSENNEPHVSQSLTLYVPETKVAEELEDVIIKVYRLIESWAQSFANKSNSHDDNQLPKLHASLWQYILQLTYRNLQDAHTHGMHLLKEPQLRAWFIMRMIIDYIVRSIWSPVAFLGFDQGTEKELHAVKEGLAKKGKHNLGRTAIGILLTDKLHRTYCH